MIEYKEMDNVVKQLNLYIDKIEKFTQTQEKLNISISEIDKIKNEILVTKEDIKKFEELVGDYTQAIKDLENQHNIIKSQFDTVLRDYKNLHSSYELLEIELKKVDSKIDGCNKDIEELSEKIDGCNKGIKKLSEKIDLKIEDCNKNILVLDENMKNSFELIKSEHKMLSENLNDISNTQKIQNVWIGLLSGILGIVLILNIILFFKFI